MMSQLRPRRAAVLLALASAIVLVMARPAAAEVDPGESRVGFLPTCTNSKKDGLESGIDCGGLHCPKCGPGKTCKSDKDCQSNQCLGGVCAFGSTCNNGIRDADETDVDCGGVNSGCLPCCWNKLCQLNADCQSGECVDGRCGEAKYCASRFLYDALGVNIQLRTFDGKEATLSPHQQPIKCGQCVCKDCPIFTTYFSLTLQGLCNSTANQAVIAALRADLIAKNQATDVTIFCVDAPVPGRRLLAGTQAEYTASVCSPEKKVDLPVGTQTGEAAGCIPALPTQPSPPSR